MDENNTHTEFKLGAKNFAIRSLQIEELNLLSKEADELTSIFFQ